MKTVSPLCLAIRNTRSIYISQARAFSKGAEFLNKGGVGQGLFTENSAKQTNLVDFISNTPIKQPKISPTLKKEVKKQMPTYLHS